MTEKCTATIVPVAASEDYLLQNNRFQEHDTQEIIRKHQIHILKLSFQSIREARTRAAMLILSTFDPFSNCAVVPMDEINVKYRYYFYFYFYFASDMLLKVL